MCLATERLEYGYLECLRSYVINTFLSPFTIISKPRYIKYQDSRGEVKNYPLRLSYIAAVWLILSLWGKGGGSGGRGGFVQCHKSTGTCLVYSGVLGFLPSFTRPGVL